MPYEPIASRVSTRPQATAYDMVKDARPDRGVTKQIVDGKPVVCTFDKNKRVAGWRVAGFHVLNFVTLGLAGGIGALTAKSQAMGSQKNINSTRHFGELYKASMTFQTGNRFGNKALKVAAQLWSLPAHLLLSPAHLLQNSLGPDMSRFRSQMSRDFGKSQWTMFSSVQGISTVAAKKRTEVYKAMWKEVSAAETRAQQSRAQSNSGQLIDYRGMPLRVATTTGSKSLQSAMLQRAEREFCSENVLFLNWSSQVLDKADPLSQNYDPNYRISKREMLDAYRNFLAVGSTYNLNLSYHSQKWMREVLDPASPRSPFGDYEQRLQQAEAFRRQDDPADHLEDSLEDIQNETFDADQTREIAENLRKWDDAIYLLTNSAYSRLKEDIATGAQDT